MLPTHELYQSLQQAYKHLNERLFDDTLPNVIFTVQRKKGVFGYFAPDRWSSPEGKYCHEIAINLSHIGQSKLLEVMQTLVHEMVHCWQYCFGKPSRSGYHNKEWANKMIEVGLQPSSTGLPGGNIIGQNMSDYPLEHGLFLKACLQLLQDEAFQIPWVDRVSAPNENEETQISIKTHSLSKVVELDQDTKRLLNMTYQQLFPKNTFIRPPLYNKSKIKYQCPGCYSNVWGKPGLNIQCGDCKHTYDVLVSP